MMVRDILEVYICGPCIKCLCPWRERACPGVDTTLLMFDCFSNIFLCLFSKRVDFFFLVLARGRQTGQLQNACVSLAKDWRTDKYLRRLEASGAGIHSNAFSLVVVQGFEKRGNNVFFV